MSYRYLPMSRSCGVGRIAANVRLDGGEIVRAESYPHGTVHDGMRVTVERRRTMCITTPYTILHTGPPNSSVGDFPVNRGE